jgi:septal ring factor EnvC (AmiA/AmiB activator)
MADDPNEDATPTETQREAQEALEKQVAQLKREINKINRTLAESAKRWSRKPLVGMRARPIACLGQRKHFAKGRLRLPVSFKKTLARCRPPSCWARR